ncbi:M12 family metallo-peptidase [Aestuariibacter sp. AA17]|uniref:M12 family metallo-peptidase n=1 Tax=Fluctibacter corallii TaxID=2984329 RepID=A0ABT3A717_9ALTE|nr:zinc-dependent metalloprotease family protein [Aestuariibacter sp. AA17]MCV2884372.1 M12 family metallo-peptidase [Aestuariibacter sp. AA17]
MKKVLKLSTLALTTAIAFSATAADTVIDVMILYSDNAASATSDIQGKIDHYIDHSNRIYANNYAELQLREVGTQSSSYTSSSVVPSEGYLEAVKNSSGINSRRGTYKADMVVFLGTADRMPDGTVCGIGYVGQGNNGTMYSSSKELMYSITAVDCASTTFVHELGHNMGLGHSQKQGSTGGVYTDGIGHGVNNVFSTIMAYPQAFGSATRLDYFSDPDWNACSGYPCGVQGVSNSYKTVMAVKDKIASFY